MPFEFFSIRMEFTKQQEDGSSSLAIPDRSSEDSDDCVEQPITASQLDGEDSDDCGEQPITASQLDGEGSDDRGEQSITASQLDGEGSDDCDEQPITAGQLDGELSGGSGQLQGLCEDRRNFAKTVRPLNYGAFGSFAPSYDSTFATLSKEESDLMYETYGDENAASYAQSVMNFAEGCSYTMNMVDNLLDSLTGGEHRKAMGVINEQRKKREEEEIRDLMESKEVTQPAVLIQNSKTVETSGDKIVVEQLKTLSDLGIDMSFLNNIGDVTDAPSQSNPIQETLQRISALIGKLHQVQTDRLSASPLVDLGHVIPPSENEINLAAKITESLTELIKQVPPGSLMSVPATR